MSWMVAVLAVLSGSGDGGTSPVPMFHEPMTRPVPVGEIDWTPPRDPAGQRISGVLIFSCVITEVGAVEDCQVVKPLAHYTEWALGKLRTARYTPVTLEGRAIRVLYVFNIHIRSQGSPPPEGVPPWRPHIPENIARACRTNAQLCNDTAMSILAGDAGPSDIDKAGRLLGAACEQEIAAACRTLDLAFQPPRMLEDLPAPSFPVPTAVQGDVSCLISADGHPHDCIAQPGPMSDWVVSKLPGVKFAPAYYRGRPFETEHAIRYAIPSHR